MKGYHKFLYVQCLSYLVKIWRYTLSRRILEFLLISLTVAVKEHYKLIHEPYQNYKDMVCVSKSMFYFGGELTFLGHLSTFEAAGNDVITQGTWLWATLVQYHTHTLVKYNTSTLVN